jgi:DNA polymerase III epsilon subunit-like protein
MEIDNVLFFDTETTGIPARGAKWEEDYLDFPHIVQIAWAFGPIEESFVVLPDNWEIPEEAVKIHGITNEEARRFGVPFKEVIEKFVGDCLSAGLIAAHNIHFDTSIVKANVLRELGREWYDSYRVEDALFKGKRIDTMQPSMKWVDARTQDGRLKFPKLEELYSRCFPGETYPAHDAWQDVLAVKRCLPILVEKGIVKLEVKEYPEDAAKKVSEAFGKRLAKKASQEKAERGEMTIPFPKNNKSTIPEPMCGNSRDLDKITELLSQDDF